VFPYLHMNNLLVDSIFLYFLYPVSIIYKPKMIVRTYPIPFRFIGKTLYTCNKHYQ